MGKEQKLIHQGKVISFYQDGSLDIIVHPGAVGILSVDQERKLLLIRQWRHPAHKKSFKKR